MKYFADSTRQKYSTCGSRHKKEELIEWAQWNKPVLLRHNIFATGTTGGLMENELEMRIIKFQSDPLGGDQQIESHIAEGKIDF